MAQIGNDIPGNTLDEEFGYNVALNGNGDTVVASAPFAPCLSGMGRCGRVAVYRFDAVASMEWVQIGADIFGFQEDGEFGASVDISFDGNRIVVGAPAPDNDAVLGIVTVFTYDGFNWNQVANTIGGLDNLDAFGRSVSMSDDGLTFAIGAPDFNSNEGLVEVYQFDSSINSWQILGGSISNLSQDRDAGWSVSLSGDGRTVTVGIASVDEPSLTGRSQIYTFDSGLQNWVQVGSDIPGLFNGDQSGYAVSNSFDGRLVAISSVDFNSDQGQVRVFQCQ
uniref:Uncharacterized protein n=1 Tax=Entomoneis paludosa TaxID=265537 RepID=A0A7S2YQX3_9STRA